MEGKNGSVVLLLALVALCFYAGQSSARRSAIDFASLIQGGAGLESAEQSCAVCACAESSTGYRHCYCTDEGPSCHENCKSCVCRFRQYCTCLDKVRSDQCKNWAISTALVEEKIMLESTPTSAYDG